MSFKSIVVATDGSANAARALDIAVDLAQRYEAPLTIVHAVISGPLPRGLVEWARVEHVVEEPKQRPPQPEAMTQGRIGLVEPEQILHASYDVREAVGRAVVDHARAHAQALGVKEADSIIDDGDAAQVIARAIEAKNADLAVVGTRGHGTLRGLLVGSVSHKLLGLGRCACLIVP